ncbi:uncharacterized protein LOC112269432 [Brachypodium distachyon]|uniref:Uncharacterized protein n=1 Tax=Brachypodium distachyon TaxID=15368 RepID=A0A2K2CFV9_BRADI|nr:uncharacterized protein LOC112269432 [Brachypodium distachyon]PNT60911.1 hypothetical protein BRADI_5g07891v3 [Brachypodium distachyon]|eukprot:XP_024311930.1 uncharacterized protein LOC112269432 [Brachypodium distachyon]
MFLFLASPVCSLRLCCSLLLFPVLFLASSSVAWCSARPTNVRLLLAEAPAAPGPSYPPLVSHATASLRSQCGGARPKLVIHVGGSPPLLHFSHRRRPSPSPSPLQPRPSRGPFSPSMAPLPSFISPAAAPPPLLRQPNWPLPEECDENAEGPGLSLWAAGMRQWKLSLGVAGTVLGGGQG